MSDQPGTTAHQEEVRSRARPTQLGGSSVDIIEQTRAVRDTADLWKVYRPEWLIVFTSKGLAGNGVLECEAHFKVKYAGRVRDEDVLIAPMFAGDGVPCKRHLRLRLWNQRGEFKHREDADRCAAELDASGTATCRVVGRNSREEQLLKDYGVKKLAKVALPACGTEGCDGNGSVCAGTCDYFKSEG